jgi:hypothetical protein
LPQFFWVPLYCGTAVGCELLEWRPPTCRMLPVLAATPCSTPLLHVQQVLSNTTARCNKCRACTPVIVPPAVERTLLFNRFCYRARCQAGLWLVLTLHGLWAAAQHAAVGSLPLLPSLSTPKACLLWVSQPRRGPALCHEPVAPARPVHKLRCPQTGPRPNVAGMWPPPRAGSRMEVYQ